METFSALLAICTGNSPVPGEFPAQRPVTRSFDVYFDLRPNKGLSKQSRGWWFETLSCSLWRHRNVRRLLIMLRPIYHGLCFVYDVFKLIVFNENASLLWCKYHCNLFPRYPLAISQHWLRWLFSAEQRGGKPLSELKVALLTCWRKYAVVDANTHYSAWNCYDDVIKWKYMFRITGPLCWKFTGHRWIPFTKASDAELWGFLWFVPE